MSLEEEDKFISVKEESVDELKVDASLETTNSKKEESENATHNESSNNSYGDDNDDDDNDDNYEGIKDESNPSSEAYEKEENSQGIANIYAPSLRDEVVKEDEVANDNNNINDDEYQEIQEEDKLQLFHEVITDNNDNDTNININVNGNNSKNAWSLVNESTKEQYFNNSDNPNRSDDSVGTSEHSENERLDTDAGTLPQKGLSEDNVINDFESHNEINHEQTTTLTLKDLFGALFEFANKDEIHISDPSLIDTQKILHDTFGSHVTEHDIYVENEENILVQEMTANKEAKHRAEVERLFGVAGTDTLIDEPTESFIVLHSTLPANVLLHSSKESSNNLPLSKPSTAETWKEPHDAASQGESEIWLVDMPKIIPNRQIMHADPQPFFPSRCAALQSNMRMLYTPYNVMRWAYHAPSETFMSNSRLIRWSDGSVTVHIGSDMHTLAQNKENASLDMLGVDTVISQDGIELPAITATVAPQSHYIVESTTAASVERALIEEGQEHRAMASLLKPVFSTSSIPTIDWNRPRKDKGNLFEEFVAHEYEQREKEIARRLRDGRTMTLAEQMAMEQEMLHRLQNTSVETLERQHENYQHEQQNKQRGQLQYGYGNGLAADSKMSSAASRHRLDRDLTLSNGSTVNPELLQFDENMMNTDEDKQHGSKRERMENNQTERQEDGESYGDNYDDADEPEMDEYEKIMTEMAAKHEKDANDERHRKMARHEESQRERFTGLITSLEKLVAELPMESNAFGSVEGTLQFLRSGVFAAGIVEKEIPLMLMEITEELPQINTTKVVASYKEIFEHVPESLESM